MKGITIEDIKNTMIDIYYDAPEHPNPSLWSAMKDSFGTVCICYYGNTREYKKAFYYFADDLLNINEEVLTKLENNNYEIP